MKQSDVSNLMKKAFKGKSHELCLVYFLQSPNNLMLCSDLYERSKGFNIPVSIVESCRNNPLEYIDFATHFIAPVIGKKKLKDIVGDRISRNMFLKVMKLWHC